MYLENLDSYISATSLFGCGKAYGAVAFLRLGIREKVDLFYIEEIADLFDNVMAERFGRDHRAGKVILAALEKVQESVEILVCVVAVPVGYIDDRAPLVTVFETGAGMYGFPQKSVDFLKNL